MKTKKLQFALTSLYDTHTHARTHEPTHTHTHTHTHTSHLSFLSEYNSKFY